MKDLGETLSAIHSQYLQEIVSMNSRLTQMEDNKNLELAVQRARIDDF